jgi:DNA-binding SARP family transcriptional activator
MRVLVPRLDVRIDGGGPLALSAMEATLLVVLVCAHPAPVHVEIVHEALWPGRRVHLRRLNTVVYRLRHRLGVAADAVVRSGTMLSLDEGRCRADLWEYRDQLARPAPARARVLTLVRGNLCDAELPYVEALIEMRHQFAATWREHAQAAFAEGSLRPADLARASASLGLDLKGPGSPAS